MALVAAQPDVDYTIKPQAITPSVDTSDWPLLLKNYDKRRTFRCYHNAFTTFGYADTSCQCLFGLVTSRPSLLGVRH